MSERCFRSGLSGGIASVVGSGRLGAAALAAALGLAGCGAPPSGDSEFATVARALEPSWWVPWTESSEENANALSSPAVCAAHARTTPMGLSGFILAGRDLSTNRYRMAMYSKLQPWLPYTDIPSSFTFSSKPVCASIDGVHTAPGEQWTNLMAFVGKRTSNNRYYIQLMRLSGGGTLINDPSPAPPPMPTVEMSWSQISADTYSSAPFVHVFEQSYMVVGGRRSDNQLYLQVNPFQWNPATERYDYDHAFWEAPITVPPLPAGWTAVGDPTIGHWGPNMSGEVRIVTRAQNGGQLKLFSLWMFVPWRWISTEWFELPAGPSEPAGDPALSYERRFWEYSEDGWPSGYASTLFYRGDDDKIYQASIAGADLLTEPFAAIQDTDGFIGAPAALGSSEMDGGHVVAARKVSPSRRYSTTNLPTFF